MKWTAPILCAFALPMMHAADWITLRTANFELYSTSMERHARPVLEAFERARDFFLRVKPFGSGGHGPVILVSFDDDKDYQPYRKNAVTLAYHAGDEGRDYIVMGASADQRERIAIHEYVHVLTRRSGLAIPLWLNEGLAEVYSTMETRDGRVFLGAISPDRNRSLTAEQWLRLPALIAARYDSPEYNDAGLAGAFYSQSWLLTHMLMLGDGYGAKFSDFVSRVASSGSTETAFAEVYKKSVAEVERDMRAYFRQATLGGASLHSGPLAAIEIEAARPAPEQEIGPALERIAALLGRPEEAIQRLERLAAAYPDNAGIEEAMGFAAWRKGDRESALGYYRQALAHGAAGWTTQWDYARLLGAASAFRDARLEALRKALEAKPDLAEARLLLGQGLFDMGRHADALAELQRVAGAEPRYASAAYLGMAYSAASLKQADEARRHADQALKSARTPEERSAVERFLANLQRGAEAAAMPSAESGDPGRPVLRRRPAQK